MTLPFTHWPDEFAARYREKGYWLDLPLSDILTRHADSDQTALIGRFLRQQGIAEFKLPDRVECVDELPLTPVGKVDKKQLRQRLA